MASHAIIRVYRPLLSELGITYLQYLVLQALRAHGGASVSGLADQLWLESNSLTPLVDQLEAAGLVTSTRHTHDRRVVSVVLTPQCVLLRERAAEAQYRAMCHTGLSDGELAGYVLICGHSQIAVR